MKKGMSKKLIWAFCVGLLCVAFFNSVNTVFAATKATFDYVEGEEVTAYKGIITTDGLNVRADAGTSNPIVQYEGNNLLLYLNDEVAIIAEKTEKSEVWYEIRFTKDGTECTGFIHSAYVNKTTDTVTPNPTPTPIPTSTPTPEPTMTATPEPTSAPATSVQVEKKEPSGLNTVLIVLFSLLLLGIVLLVVFWQLRKRSLLAKASEETNDKIDNLRSAPLRKENPVPSMQRKDSMKYARHTETKEPSKEANDEIEELVGKERAKQVNAAIMEEYRKEDENADHVLEEAVESKRAKEILKEEIDRMMPGDIVYHKYFGKGVVYDNSDIKVIEVRFGPDVRFLNKTSCANKKLLKK